MTLVCLKFYAALLFLFFAHMPNVSAIEPQSKIIKKMEEAAKTTKTPSPEAVSSRPKLDYKAKGFRDPFQPPKVEVSKEDGERAGPEKPGPSVSKTPPPAFAIQGIISGGAFPLAIINNKVVKEADTLEGARIISINKDNIAFLFEGAQYNLASPASVIRKGKAKSD